MALCHLIAYRYSATEQPYTDLTKLQVRYVTCPPSVLHISQWIPLKRIV